MAKTSQELTNLRADRAKSLFDWWKANHPGERKTQQELANYMGILPESLNAKLNRKRTLTENDARKIAEFFSVRFEYIMCFDDFPTFADLNAHAIQTAQQEGNLLYAGLYCLATLSGYQIETPFTGLSKDGKAEDLIAAIKGGFTIERNGKRISLSLEEMNNFENHLCSYVENELEFIFKMKGVSE